MANVLTVVAKLSAKPGKGDELAPIHVAAFRARRDPLVAGPPEVEFYLSVTD